MAMLDPDPAVAAEPRLYHRLAGPARALPQGGIGLEPGGTALFDTYFNIFDAGLWQRLCPGTRLAFQVSGTGEVDLTLHARLPGEAPRIWHRQRLTLAPEPQALELPAVPGALLWPGIRAVTPARLAGFSWHDRAAPRRLPRLALCVTSFRRDDAVRATLGRFRAAFAGSPFAPHLALIVTDNGASPDLQAAFGQAAFETTAFPGTAPPAILVPNRNLGGSGGFARGLIEAEARGATHCLFLDDDAACPMESVARAWALLARAEDPATAVLGAMLDTARPWSVWENGARFHRFCRPLDNRADLRDPERLHRLLDAAAGPPPPGLYAGWWFFAFPLAAVRALPFPFFVRGDDVGFALANPFALRRLPGVASAQENFPDKETPLTWYLDLRSHLAHPLALPLGTGAFSGLLVACLFAVKALVRMHYETLHAVILATEDTLQGPDAYTADPGLVRRRADIAALTVAERWQAGARAPLPPLRPRPSGPWLWLMKLTLNGHLLPGFGWFGARHALGLSQRALVPAHWGAARADYLAPDGRHYAVRHSKARAARLGLRFLWAALRLVLAWPRLRRDWRRAYPGITTRDWWRQALDLPAPDPARAPPPSLFPETSCAEPSPSPRSIPA
jgi:GT2 family glycosyltransferase